MKALGGSLEPQRVVLLVPRNPLNPSLSCGTALIIVGVCKGRTQVNGDFFLHKKDDVSNQTKECRLNSNVFLKYKFMSFL